MRNYGNVEVWINVSGIANIFSLSAFKNIGYDEYYLVNNRKTDVSTKFEEDENGLPYVEATKEGVMFVQTVRHIFERFNKN